MTIEQLETAIISDVVTRFANLKETTSRRALLIKFRGQPAWQGISNLTNQNILRRTGNTVTAEEDYLPSAAAFHFCGNVELRNQAKFALTVVLHALQEMYVGEQKKDGFVFEDLRRHVEAIYTNKGFEDETLKLGLYLAQDFSVLMSYRLNEPAKTEVVSFQVGEGAVTMANPDTEWDRIMAGYGRPVALPTNASVADIERAFRAQGELEWERIRPLGGGGQSDVFLVRSPARVSERASCLARIRKALDEDKRAELAEASWSYARQEAGSDLGALKVFKIPREGKTLTPLPGSEQYEAIERLKNEITVLSQDRPGLPKLLSSNIAERWIVTEYFSEGTLEQCPQKFRGNARSSLKAFRSLVQTVALLHKDGYVHRDIKPPNVFIRKDDELVLGDFGIVYVPSLADRVTLAGERVGPRDYMPQWANLGTRNEKVEPCFDVYMLGKLLWSMVDGRMFLPREYYNRAEFDLTQTFRGDPDMFLINSILKACIVEEARQCLSSADDLLLAVDTTLRIMESGGQLLSPGVPRPCHICGNGFYQAHRFSKENTTASMRLWMSGGAQDIQVVGVQLFSCDKCGHIEFFKT